MRRHLIWFLILPVSASEYYFETPLDRVSWFYQGDQFRCSLTHQVENYGEVQIRVIPEQGATWRITSASLMKEGDVSRQLFSSEGPWSAKGKVLIELEALQQKNAVTFSDTHKRALSSLLSGRWIHLQAKVSDSTHWVAVPPINAKAEFEQFRVCMAQLPGISFETARDTVLYFSNGQRMPNAQQITKIDELVTYINADQGVKKVLIDGHSDNTGSNIGNLHLSKHRADEVASMMTEKGVSIDLIETRGHGERYPIASNIEAVGRAMNRRVTIRIIRQDNQG